MSDFEKFLEDLPDGWGRIYKPNIHPSSVKQPSCLRRFMFATRLGWCQPFEFREALTVGSIFHRVMQLTREGADPTTAAGITREQYEREMADQKAATAELDTPFPEDKYTKAIALGVALGVAFNEAFPLRETVLRTELTISVDIDNEMFHGLTIEGTLDTVVKDAEGSLWIEDHKSTSLTPSDRAEGLTFDTQSQLYRYLLDTHLGGKPAVKGVIHNIIKKPGIRQRTKQKPETLDEYVERALKEYDLQSCKDPNHPPMLRSHVRFTSPPLLENGELLTSIIQRSWINQAPLTLNGFPRCGYSYGGCVVDRRVCPYMPLCKRENPKDWLQVLQRSFTKRNPDEDNDE
jgi:hypothetical protein